MIRTIEAAVLCAVNDCSESTSSLFNRQIALTTRSLIQARCWTAVLEVSHGLFSLLLYVSQLYVVVFKKWRRAPRSVTTESEFICALNLTITYTRDELDLGSACWSSEEVLENAAKNFTEFDPRYSFLLLPNAQKSSLLFLKWMRWRNRDFKDADGVIAPVDCTYGV